VDLHGLAWRLRHRRHRQIRRPRLLHDLRSAYPLDHARPVAGWDWTIDNLNYALKVVPKEKPSLGIPLYGYHWYTGAPTEDTPSSPGHSAYFFFYRDQMREWVFFTDLRTFQDRYQLVQKNNLQGFCSWVLGEEDPAVSPHPPLTQPPRSHSEHVTAHPTTEWTGQQLRETFPFDQLPRYLLRDRHAIFGDEFREQVRGMGICEVLCAPRSPWQRDYVERVIGSVRRECLDHMIVLHESSLRRILTSYFDYYHRSRTHLSWGKDSPEPRTIQPPETGSVVVVPQVGGLHHRYERRAA
jgi:hypothetical protein